MQAYDGAVCKDTQVRSRLAAVLNDVTMLQSFS